MPVHAQRLVSQVAVWPGVGLVLAAAVLTTGATAATFTPQTQPSAVTIYPQGAEISREINVDVPAGDHQIVIADVPDGIDRNRVQVDGKAIASLAIQSIDVARLPVAVDETRTKALQAELDKLTDEVERLAGIVRTAEAQRRMILALVEPRATDEEGGSALAPSALFDFIEERHMAVEARILAARQEQRALAPRIDDLRRQLQRQDNVAHYATSVTIKVTAATATKGVLRLRYSQSQSGWRPVYDARLETVKTADDTENSRLTLIQRAAIFQRTGEDWRDVAITLSTTLADGATAAPRPQVQVVDFHQPPLPATAARQEMLRKSRAVAAPATEETYAGNVDQLQARIVDHGFDARYVVPGRADIVSSPDERLLKITEVMAPASLDARLVPAMDRYAYLSATFQFAGKAPMPAGEVNLFRDDVFIGQTALSTLNPGADIILGFGRDERIHVERQQVSGVKGEDGLFTRSSTDEKAWLTKITNRHTSPMAILLVDTLPVAGHEDIKIKLLDQSDTPTDTAFENRPGIVAWRFTLASQEARDIRFGYRVDWPKDRQVTTSTR